MIKVLGVVFVISACGGVGLMLAAAHRREERSLRQLLCIIDFMVCELQYRLTPLPTLCEMIGREFPQLAGKVFAELGKEMELQIYADASCCMGAVLSRCQDLPPITRTEIIQLGRSLGRFDMEGQLRGLEGVREDCKIQLEQLSNNRDNRLRSYQTLGLCAGAALAILLI